MNKKILIFLLGLTIFLGSLWYLGQKRGPFITFAPSKVTPAVEATPSSPPLPVATLVLDFGGFYATAAASPLEEKIATYSGIRAKSALEILEKVASEAGVNIKVKKYDFGSLVEEVAGVKNTKDYAWIYFVNGKSPDVAADKYELKEGDLVEWKYIEPTF